MKSYQPRRIFRHPNLTAGDWDLKRYAITMESATVEPTRFEGARSLALAALPLPARTSHRLGVGFLIEHQGDGVDYCILAWWDRENELPIRVFVQEPGAGWRPARGSESVCVWDLEVIAAERAAYVATALAGSVTDARVTYLGSVSPSPG
jgi:hypothetical protein